MHLRFALLMTCLAFLVSTAQAQFQAALNNFDQVLTMACDGGTPIPDNTTIQVWWDSTANGINDDDVQPQEGAGFNQANFNQFLLNGEALLGVPGTFATEVNFVFPVNTPSPTEGTGHPVFYLKICLDAQGIFWTSDTFRVVSGYQEIYFGPGLEHALVCSTGVCGGCPSPTQVFNVNASTNLCDRVTITWDHDMDNIAGYRVYNTYNDTYHFIPGAANQSIDITDIPGGTDIEFRVRAFRICDLDTSYSTAVLDTGRRRVTPPTPQNMSASDANCGSVTVQWTVNTILGLDSFFVFRADLPNDTIGRLSRGNAGQVRTFVDNNPPANAVQYCVRGWSATCGLGTATCDNGQAGAAPACTITNVSATTDRCDSVCVTWTATCADADSFHIFRSNLQVGAVSAAGGPNYTFCHAPQAGQDGLYQIRAKNTCGNGTLQPEPGVTGTRLAAPGNVTGVSASDTLCSEVCVTWNDLPAAEEYEVRRDNTTLATVPGDQNSYCDDTAVPGVTYTYRVVGLNDCGTGSVGNGNTGTRRAAGTGTATFAMTQAGPPNWSYDMTVTSGCLNKVVIRDYCEGTTATAPTGWTVTVHGLDSIVYSSTTTYAATEVVTGFQLHHETCDGDGRWNSGQSGGLIRGPLPVGENALLPTEYSVNVYPNPFNPMTNFKIAVPQASETRIVVFNITGQVVRDMNMGRLQAGYHTVQFGGSDLPSGMYFARVQAGGFHSTHKLMLLK
ncbi:MAG: T9SS type A sorting domain-containing protein [Calditrichaeota bacterium]|nr:T9SS type A sorting domain-containing protein [Calditrichota bacterium]